MAGPFWPIGMVVACALLAGASACSSDASDAARHRRTLRSLSATATVVAQGWLDGSLSSRSAGTDLEKTFSLLQQERRALTDDPSRIGAGPLGALAREADDDARLFALMLRDIEAYDRNALRQHAAEADRGAVR